MQERFDKLQQAASDGDEYGLKRHLQYGFLQVDAARRFNNWLLLLLEQDM